MKEPVILAIDTSCDETCAAVSYGRRILSNVISSQINLHAPYGGVVPHLAKRAHQEKIGYVIKEALKKYSPDAIAVTVGPGLAPALEVGIAFAKNLASKLKKPLIAVNHMEGHLLSAFAKPRLRQINFQRAASHLIQSDSCEHCKISSAEPNLPALGLLASGGHTQLVLVKSIGHYQLLGETLDDAAGEALDKLAKMLHLGYPGGPIIEQLAKQGNPEAIKLPIPLQQSPNLNFSFSGLKTAALYQIKSVGSVLTVKYTQDMAASFQEAIAKSLNLKLKKAIEQYQPKSILLGGGVFSNLYFRGQIRSVAKQHSLPLYLPYSKKLYTDNAAMICIPAYFKFLRHEFVKDIHGLDRQPSLNFC